MEHCLRESFDHSSVITVHLVENENTYWYSSSCIDHYIDHDAATGLELLLILTGWTVAFQFTSDIFSESDVESTWICVNISTILEKKIQVVVVFWTPIGFKGILHRSYTVLKLRISVLNVFKLLVLGTSHWSTYIHLNNHLDSVCTFSKLKYKYFSKFIEPPVYLKPTS